MKWTKLSYVVVATLALQALCLAIGLWIQYRFVVRSAESKAEAETHKELASASKLVLPPLEQIVSRGIGLGANLAAANPRPVLDLTGDVAADLLAPIENMPVLVVDDQWRIVADVQTNAQHQHIWDGEEVLTWQDSDAWHDSGSSARAGWLETTKGLQVATAHLLGDTGYWAIFYAPKTSLDAGAAVFFETLPAAGILAFCWIGGLQGAVVFVMLMRMDRQRTDTQTRSDREALQRTQDLIRTREAVIFGLARLAESRDRATGDHLERIALFSARLTAVLRRYPKFREAITPSFIRLIGISSSLHDVGKVGIEDSILLKPCELTPAERRRMQEHTTIGSDCLKSMEQRLGSSNFLQMAREITLCHHERWDGTGYPNGLAGEQIPLAARIVAVADVYDALSSRRVYKEAFDRKQCAQKIAEQSGKQFDPDLVAAFLEIEPEFWRIALQHMDRAFSDTLPIRNDRPEVLEITDADDGVRSETGIETAVDKLESLLTDT